MRSTREQVNGSRRRKGEGSIGRHHTTQVGCPAAVNGVRPKHNCKGLWTARVTVSDPISGGRVRKTLYGKTEREVVRKKRDAEVAQATGTLVLHSITLNAWIEQWYESDVTGLRPNTRKAYRSKIDRYIKPALGERKLDQLAPAHINALWRDMRSRGLAEATLRQTHMVLHRCLKVAMDNGYVARNVTKLAKVPSTEVHARRGLTVPEVEQILSYVGNEPRYWVALTCGLRQGEALALRWMDLHLDNEPAFLIVARSVSREPGVGLVYGPPKSKASTDRVVPLVPALRSRLIVKRAEAMANGATEDDLVFPGVSLQNDSHDWMMMLSRLGIPHTPLHAARNTAAHLLEDSGTGARVVAEILGHVSVKQTYRYQDGNLSGKVGAMKALGTLLDANHPNAGGAA